MITDKQLAGLEQAARLISDAWSPEARKASAEARKAHSEKFNSQLSESLNNSRGSWAQSIPHEDAHQFMIGAGFKRTASKHGINRVKMGRSQAYSSSKVQNSEYNHPEGYIGSTKTNTPKYGESGPMTYFNISRP